MPPKQYVDKAHDAQNQEHGAADDDQRVQVQQVWRWTNLLCTEKRECKKIILTWTVILESWTFPVEKVYLLHCTMIDNYLTAPVGSN